MSKILGCTWVAKVDIIWHLFVSNMNPFNPKTSLYATEFPDEESFRVYRVWKKHKMTRDLA